MNEQSKDPATPASTEDRVKECIKRARQSMRQRHQNCETAIRQSPTSSVLYAVAVGYVLHLLPLRAIILTKVRIISALAIPALMLFGAAKIVENLQRLKTKNAE